MPNRTRCHRQLIALASAFVVLVSACSSATNDKARTDVAALESNNSWDARIPVYVYNDSDQTVILNIGTENNKDCPKNKWIYKGSDRQSGRLDPIGPGRRINDLFISTQACDSSKIPSTSSAAFTIGIEGASQFEFSPSYTGPHYNRYLDYLKWSGNYTGGGNTGGLVQYNAGNSAILGNGKPGANDNFDYRQGQQVYFSFCPEVAGRTGVNLPARCRV